MNELIKHLIAVDGQAIDKIFINEITRLMEEIEELKTMLNNCSCETNLRKIKKSKKSSGILK